eukprot:4795986-Prymnesium_polylepis.2
MCVHRSPFVRAPLSFWRASALLALGRCAALLSAVSPYADALGYGIRDVGCRTLVMTYGRDSAGFAEQLQLAMRDMRDAAEKA